MIIFNALDLFDCIDRIDCKGCHLLKHVVILDRNDCIDRITQAPYIYELPPNISVHAGSLLDHSFVQFDWLSGKGKPAHSKPAPLLNRSH